MTGATSSPIDAVTGGGAGAAAQRIVHRRHWGAWAFGVLVLALFATLVKAAIDSRIVDLGIVGKYIFSTQIVTGAWSSLAPFFSKATTTTQSGMSVSPAQAICLTKSAPITISTSR